VLFSTPGINMEYSVYFLQKALYPIRRFGR